MNLVHYRNFIRKFGHRVCFSGFDKTGWYKTIVINRKKMFLKKSKALHYLYFSNH